MYTWQRLLEEQLSGDPRREGVQLRYMIVLSPVMLNGAVWLSWTPVVEISSVTQVLGRKLDGWITRRCDWGLIDVIG